MTNGPEETRPAVLSEPFLDGEIPATRFSCEEPAPNPDSLKEQASADLPDDFDPASDEQVRALNDEQVAGVFDDLALVHDSLVGTGADVAWAFLNPDRFHPSPGHDPIAYACLREFVRRVVQIPDYNLTQAYLFGDQGEQDA